MWPSAARRVLGWFGAQKIANELLGWTLNRDEAYVDRIKREFNLRDYHQARALYDSNPAYWEQLYGDDPVTSRNHPASAPSSLVPRQPPAGDPSYNLFDPSPMGANAFGPFGSGGRFAPSATTSSRPSSGSVSPDTIDDSRPARRLGRIGDTPGGTVFDSGASAVPFVSPSPIPSPGRPATFNERFPASLPPASAPTATASPDDLETFRRQWLKTFMEP
jgi:hypothetical protein